MSHYPEGKQAQYILNPVRAAMPDDTGRYNWSSYRSNALRAPSDLVSPHSIYDSLGSIPEDRAYIYRSLFLEVLDGEVVDDLRKATNRCMAFGSEYFKEQIELQYARRLRPESPVLKVEH